MGTESLEGIGKSLRHLMDTGCVTLFKRFIEVLACCSENAELVILSSDHVGNPGVVVPLYPGVQHPKLFQLKPGCGLAGERQEEIGHGFVTTVDGQSVDCGCLVVKLAPQSWMSERTRRHRSLV
jgi:hypothetical protein